MVTSMLRGVGRPKKPPKQWTRWSQATDDTLKRCPRCGESKPVKTAFIWIKGGTQPNTYCKTCWAELARINYEKPRQTSLWYDATDETLKRCPKCGEEKPVLIDFYWIKKHTIPSPYCKPCSTDYSLEWNRAHPELVKKRARISYDKTLYGLPPEARAEMTDVQSGLCAICCQPPPAHHKNQVLHMDHDADTGQVRGLLCTGCNTALGGFVHDPIRLERAAQYLLLAAVLRALGLS